MSMCRVDGLEPMVRAHCGTVVSGTLLRAAGLGLSEPTFRFHAIIRDATAALNKYVKTYNHLISQRALKHISPVQALKNWHAKKPELFKKRVYNQSGLDNWQRFQVFP